MTTQNPGRQARALVGALVVALAALSVATAGSDGPSITSPVLFDTPEADRILSAMQIFPPDSAWHGDVSERPLHGMEIVPDGWSGQRKIRCAK